MRSEGVRTRVLMSMRDSIASRSQGAEDRRKLWILPNSPVSKEEVCRYLSDWGNEAAAEGTAVSVESAEEGILFTFKASTESYLAFDVLSTENGAGSSIEIVSRLAIHDGSNQKGGGGAGISNLVGMVAQNLIDSLCLDIGDILMSGPDKVAETTIRAEDDGNTDTETSEQEEFDITDSELQEGQFLRQLEKMAPSSASNEVSKADLEASLSAALPATSPKKEAASECYLGVVTQKWSNVAAGQEVVVANYIRSWADQKFAGRGAGIEAVDIPFGVKLTFAVSDLLCLRLCVHSEFFDSTRIKDLYALAELVVIEDGDEEDIEDGSQTRVSKKLSKETELVSTAAQNIAASLRKDLGTLILDPAAVLSGADGAEAGLKDEEVVVAGEKPILGDLSLGDDAARMLAKAEQERRTNKNRKDDDLRSRLKEQQTQGKTPEKASAAPTIATAPTTQPNNPFDSGLEGSNEDQEHVRASILSRGKAKPESSAAPVAGTGAKKDPYVQEKAWKEGVKLESFEGRGLEEQALQELQDMMKSSEKEGFLAVLKQHREGKGRATGSGNGGEVLDVNTEQDLDALLQEGASYSGRERDKLVEQARAQAEARGQDEEGDSLTDQAAVLLSRNNRASQTEDLSQPGTAFPMDLERAGFATINPRSDPADRNGPNGLGPEGTDIIDVFQGPPRPEGVQQGDAIPAPASSIEGQVAAAEAAKYPPNPSTLDKDDRTLKLLVNELQRLPTERHGEVLASYKDLLLSENLLYLLRRDNDSVREEGKRAVYKKITDTAQEVLLEVGALVKSESVRHLDTIMKVCEVAAMHQQDEEEFLDRMAPLRSYFDTALLGYLGYAIEEEEAGIVAHGGDPINMPSRWLSVLRLVQQGVLAEFESRFDRLLEPLLLVVRFEQPEVRAAVFERFVNITAAVDLPHMRQLGVNMVEGIVQRAAQGEAIEPALVTILESFRFDCLEKFLSEEIVAEKMAVFEAEVDAQGRELVVRKRHPLVQAQIEDMDEERRKRGMAPILTDGKGEGSAADVDMVGESIIRTKRQRASEREWGPSDKGMLE